MKKPQSIKRTTIFLRVTALLLFTTSILAFTTKENINLAGNNPDYTIGLNEELGGYVFYVTPGGKHGLVVATQDQVTSSNWYNAQNVISNPEYHNEAGKGFTDWRLPTKHELNLIYKQRESIEGLTEEWYWSSTENSHSNAWIQRFNDGNQNFSHKNNNHHVRAVRSF